MISGVFKALGALLLGYIAYRDYKKGTIVRWQGLLFLILSFISVAVVSIEKALVLLLLSGVIGVGLVFLKGIKRFDAVILTGAVLLTENIWLPFLVAILAGLLYMAVFLKTGHKPGRWYPYTPIILVAWLLLTLWG